MKMKSGRCVTENDFAVERGDAFQRSPAGFEPAADKTHIELKVNLR